MKTTFILIISFLSCTVQGQKSTRPVWADGIDRAIGKLVLENGPGGIVAVAKGNQILYTKSFGYADVAKQKLNSPSTLFDIASCSKQFTAASVLMLVEQGKIDLQKPIQDYLPEFRIKTPIPIHSILTHSSGLQDYSEMALLARGREEAFTFSSKETLELIFKQTALSFEPTTGENYSNSNFAILAKLVERVSNQKFTDYVREHFFTHLNINSDEIQFINNVTASNPNNAVGYPNRNKGESDFIPDTKSNKNVLYGAGGLRANVFGLAKWMGNYERASLGEKKLIDLLLTKDTLANGELTKYARGLESGTTGTGYKWVRHTGRSNSTTSIMLWFPDYDISIIGLMNTQEIWAQSVTNKFYNDVLAVMPMIGTKNEISKLEEPKKEVEEFQPSIVPQQEVELSINNLKKFVGIYPAGAPVGSHTPPSGGVGVDKIIFNDGKLQYELYNGYTIDLKPISPNVLEMIGLDRPIQLRFVDLDLARPGIITVDPLANDGKPAEEVVYQIPETAAIELQKFCGKYSSPSLINSIPIEILFEDGNLFMQWGILKKRSRLYYLGNDRLTTWQSGNNSGMQCNLIIKRDSTEVISGFSYEGHRVWNLFFEKI